jgi:hypothetical protein
MSNRYDYTVLIDGVDATAVFNKMGGSAAAQRYLSGELVFTETQPKPAPAPEPPLDFLIHVDRSVRPSYPDWAKHDSVNNPGFVALEATGPADYDLSTVDQYLYGKQKTGGYETGNAIYKHLKDTSALVDCYGLADLLAIQAKCNKPGGIAVFRALFKGKAVFGWKSVVEGQGGSLRVPGLVEDDGGVVLRWLWLDDDYFHSRNPALRFRK